MNFNRCPVCQQPPYVGRLSAMTWGVKCEHCGITIERITPSWVRASRRENWKLRLFFEVWTIWQALTAPADNSPGSTLRKDNGPKKHPPTERRAMGIKKSAGQPATYCGELYAPSSLPRAKYPPIESGDPGVVVPRHKWELEKEPDRPWAFYPAKWGYIFYKAVGSHEIKFTQGGGQNANDT